MLSHARTLFLCLLTLVFLQPSIYAQDTAPPKADVQTTSRASYEVLLQILISSETAASEKLPAALADVEKKLRSEFGQRSYRLASTLLNRVSERGTLEVKGVGTFFESANSQPNFVEFLAVGLKPIEEDTIQIDNFRFGIRLPVATQIISQDGKTNQVFNYENTGITARPLSVAANQPTIIGTMTTSRLNELIVLVLTVKPEAAPNRSIATKRN
jgi:hypothetical protein